MKICIRKRQYLKTKIKCYCANFKKIFKYFFKYMLKNNF